MKYFDYQLKKLWKIHKQNFRQRKIASGIHHHIIWLFNIYSHGWQWERWHILYTTYIYSKISLKWTPSGLLKSVQFWEVFTYGRCIFNKNRSVGPKPCSKSEVFTNRGFTVIYDKLLRDLQNSNTRPFRREAVNTIKKDTIFV